MKTLILCTVAVLVSYAASASNSKQNFCQKNRCLTCVGRYCTTTCLGEDCKECPLGDCCDGTNCNICRGDNCCKTGECNSCIVSCLKKCKGTATCHYDCFQECNPNPEPNRNQTNYISINNYTPVNVTTIINITNTIETENSIYNPIIVNTTNYNNYTRNQVIINNAPSANCCEVVHPEICHDIPKEGRFCYTGKHNECSAICVSKHVHIVENKQEQRTCVTVAKAPYYFCGNYVVENCEGCYNCTEINEVDGCLESPECSEICKNSTISEEFYNKLYRRD